MICAWSAWEWSTHNRLSREPAVRIASVFRCICSAPRRLFLTLKELSPAFPMVLVLLPPRRSSVSTSGDRKWICWREWRRRVLSPFPPFRFVGHSPGSEAVTSPRGTDSALLFSLSEEDECESTEALPPVLPQYEELLEAMTHAVAKLNICWPVEEHAEPQTSKLDERFLRAKRTPPTWSLSFFPDLHTEVSRSWASPFSDRLFVPSSDYYDNAGNMGGIEAARLQSDASGRKDAREFPHCGIISEGSFLSLQATTKNFSACGKGYVAAGQAGACRHTMSVLQAYQADLLKETDEREAMSSDDIMEFRRTADLALRPGQNLDISIERPACASGPVWRCRRVRLRQTEEGS